VPEKDNRSLGDVYLDMGFLQEWDIDFVFGNYVESQEEYQQILGFVTSSSFFSSCLEKGYVQQRVLQARVFERKYRKTIKSELKNANLIYNVKSLRMCKKFRKAGILFLS
jgi:hypothetical protein